MSKTEQPSGTDMYDDELDCVYEEGENEKVEVKEEEEDSETDYNALKGVDQPEGNEAQSTESVIKTEGQTESTIDMFDDEFHLIMEQDFSAAKNANETSEAVRLNEEHETDSDATEIDDEDNGAVSESHQAEPVTNNSSSSASGQLNRRRRRAKSHKCQQCDKSFDHPSFLKRHQVVHTGIRAHKCTTCSKSFGEKGTLKKHQLLHTGIRAHKCPTCSKSFGLKTNLKRHQVVHTGIQAYKCTTCSKTFSQKSYLTTHQAVHSHSRPFQCSICEQTFKWKQHFKRHLRKVHQQ